MFNIKTQSVHELEVEGIPNTRMINVKLKKRKTKIKAHLKMKATQMTRSKLCINIKTFNGIIIRNGVEMDDEKCRYTLHGTICILRKHFLRNDQVSIKNSHTQ